MVAKKTDGHKIGGIMPRWMSQSVYILGFSIFWCLTRRWIMMRCGCGTGLRRHKPCVRPAPSTSFCSRVGRTVEYSSTQYLFGPLPARLCTLLRHSVPHYVPSPLHQPPVHPTVAFGLARDMSEIHHAQFSEALAVDGSCAATVLQKNPPQFHAVRCLLVSRFLQCTRHRAFVRLLTSSIYQKRACVDSRHCNMVSIMESLKHKAKSASDLDKRHGGCAAALSTLPGP